MMGRCLPLMTASICRKATMENASELADVLECSLKVLDEVEHGLLAARNALREEWVLVENPVEVVHVIRVVWRIALGVVGLCVRLDGDVVGVHGHPKRVWPSINGCNKHLAFFAVNLEFALDLELRLADEIAQQVG